MAATSQAEFYGKVTVARGRKTPFATWLARVDWLLFATLIVAFLLSGVVQYVNIFLLTAINILLQFLLLFRINFRFSRLIYPAVMVITIYLLYVGILYMNSSAGPSHYIAFRFHDIITALLILNYILVRRPDFLFTLGAVFIFFLVHGIINWLIVSFAFQLFHPSPGIKAYNFLIFFGMNEKYFGIHRSQGLFWEPGVFQIYLNVALHFFLFYKRQKFWAGLALVSVILTLSTTGIVIAGLQMAYAVIRGRGSPVNKALIILLSLPLLIVYVEFASTVVTDKISGDRAGSYWSRSFDTRNGLAIALDNPFGIGFDPSVYQAIAKQNIFNIQTNIVTDRGNTNGIVMLIYSTGWFWAFIFLTSTYLQKIFPEHRLLFFLVLFLSMSSSPLTFSPFFFLFTLSGFVKSGPLLRPPSR